MGTRIVRRHILHRGRGVSTESRRINLPLDAIIFFLSTCNTSIILFSGSQMVVVPVKEITSLPCQLNSFYVIVKLVIKEVTTYKRRIQSEKEGTRSLVVSGYLNSFRKNSKSSRMNKVVTFRVSERVVTYDCKIIVIINRLVT